MSAELGWPVVVSALAAPVVMAGDEVGAVGWPGRRRRAAIRRRCGWSHARCRGSLTMAM